MKAAGLLVDDKRLLRLWYADEDEDVADEEADDRRLLLWIIKGRLYCSNAVFMLLMYWRSSATNSFINRSRSCMSSSASIAKHE